MFNMGARRVVLAFTLLPILEVWSTSADYPLSDRELRVRAGYYTDGGKYLGGIPKYKNELKLFECTEFDWDNSSSSNVTESSSATDHNITNANATARAEGYATVCTRWTVDRLGADECAVGSCSCVAVSNNDEYCDAWTCSQREAWTCSELEVENGISCTGLESKCFFEKEVESTRCTCEAEDENTANFCALWTCVETDEDGTQEIQEYDCARASPSAEYCEAWTRVSETSEEVEVSTCECVAQWDGAGVCSYWECRERRMDKCAQPDSSWCDMGMSMGFGGFLGSLGAAVLACVIGAPKEFKGLQPVFFPVVWMAAWSAGVVIWGGQDGAMYAGIWWGAIIASGFCCRRHSARPDCSADRDRSGTEMVPQ